MVTKYVEYQHVRVYELGSPSVSRSVHYIEHSLHASAYPMAYLKLPFSPDAIAMLAP